MKIEKRKVKDLKFYLGNPRQMKPEMLRKLENSIKEFGIVEPLVINKNNEVIGGNQRLKALQKLGIDEVDVIVLDLEKSKEKALNLALNKIEGEWDYKLLKDFIVDLEIEDIELTGFEKEDFESLDIDLILNDDLEKSGLKQIYGTDKAGIRIGDWFGSIERTEKFLNLENKLLEKTENLSDAEKIAEKIINILLDNLNEVFSF